MDWLTSLLALLTITLAALPVRGLAARDRIEGPVKAELIRVVDGDTVLVAASPWPEHSITTYVRLRGIDTPELTSQCAELRQAAERAAERLAHVLQDNRTVYLVGISGDKYYGRVVAEIRLPDGRSAADLLLAEGLATAYDGGRKPQRVCAVQE